LCNQDEPSGDEIEPVEWHCIECYWYLCSRHKTLHLKQEKGHKIVEKNSSLIVTKVFCKDHKEEEVKVFCQNCKIAVCRDCAITNHKPHATVFINDPRDIPVLMAKANAPTTSVFGSSENVYLFCGNIHRLDPNKGVYQPVSSGWGNTKNATLYDGKFYTVTSKLYRVNPGDGQWEVVSEDNWENSRALVTLGQKIYSFCKKTYEIDPSNGNYRPLSEFDSTETRSATVFGDAIYALTNDKIYRVRTDGVWEEISTENWSNCRLIVAGKDKLYAFSNNLYEIDPVNGSSKVVSAANWSTAKVGTASGNVAFVVTDNGKFYQVELESGAYKVVNSEDWANANALLVC